jgi:hypothetical protein
VIVPAVTDAQKTMLVNYLAEKVGVGVESLVGKMPFEVLAVIRGGRGLGAVLYTNYRETSIEMCWAGEPGWVTRGDLRSIFSYPFIQLGCLRASGCIKRSNSASRLFAARIGCREIGVLEDEYGPGADGILYTITRDKCRWIGPDCKLQMNGYRSHGQEDTQNPRSL